MKTQSFILCLAMTLSCLADQSNYESPTITEQMLKALPAGITLQLCDYKNLLQYPTIDKRHFLPLKTDEDASLHISFSKDNNLLKIDSITNLAETIKIHPDDLNRQLLALARYNKRNKEDNDDQYTTCEAFLLKKQNNSYIFSTQCTTLFDLQDKKTQAFLEKITDLKKQEQQ